MNGSGDGRGFEFLINVGKPQRKTQMKLNDKARKLRTFWHGWLPTWGAWRMNWDSIASRLNSWRADHNRLPYLKEFGYK